MRIVTSWGPKGWDLYGKNFLESTRLWDSNISLTIYVDGMDPAEVSCQHRAVEVKRLEEVEGFNEFKRAHADKDGNTPEGYNYRLDAVKFCAKVFALHDAARDPAPFLWLDGDVLTTKPLTIGWLHDICKGHVTHLGRKGINYSETGFIYFAGNEGRTLIADMYDIYMTGEIFNYSEWTDAFIFERVLQMHKMHGLEAVNLVDPDYVGLDAFENSPLKEVFTHLKGARKNTKVIPGLRTRYDQLLALVQHYMPSTILETGTWNGDRALQMAQVAFGKHDHVVYHGYDLFEEASADTDAKEHNIKKHFSLEDVTKKLGEFAEAMAAKGKKFEFHLTKGDTKDTLREVAGVEFAWLDGGHSVDTIAHDWEMCKRIPVVVFDDYYVADPEGGMPAAEFRGVEATFTRILREKRVYKSKDRVSGGGIVQIAAVGEGLPDLPGAGMGGVPLKVTAQDCMPKDHIISNVKENMELLSRWVTKARPHSRKLVIVSAGPDIHKRKDKILKMWREGADVAVVKHSLPTVLGWGIDPHYLVLLDPRPVDGISTHGIKRTDLLQDIPPTTKVLVASMSDPSVTKHVMARTKNVWGWHAMTQALLKSEVFPPGSLLVNGGTCAAWRAMSLSLSLGYSEFHLFGFDFCYPEGQIDKTAKDEQGRPKYMEISIGQTGKKFWSTGELIAASQDAQYFFEHAREMGMRIYCHGEGVGPTIWKLILGDKKQELSTLEEIFK
jgi:hypothetical protein